MDPYNYGILTRYSRGSAVSRITVTALDDKTVQLTEKRYDPLTGDELAPSATNISVADLEALRDEIDAILSAFTKALDRRQEGAA